MTSNSAVVQPTAFQALPVPRSAFQAEHISAVKLAAKELADNGFIQDAAWYAKFRKQLEGLIADAGFMGYPRAARLGRVIYNALPHVRDSKNTQQLTTLCESLQELLSACESPEKAEQLNVPRALAALQTELSVDRDDLLAPLTTYASTQTVSQSVAADTKGSKAGEHSDSSVYSSAVLDMLDQCEVEETWIVSQLAAVAEDVASGGDKGQPAHRLMHVLRNHRFLQAIDRVAIVGLVRNSNQLIVVDSCISQRARDFHGENPMQKGYSCFVNAVGSLSKMRPGVLRIFGDSERVMKSFAEQGQPAQRSIAHIVDTGIRSGMCMAIGRGELVQGYLFMNSLQPDIFTEVRTRVAPLLSLLSVSSTAALDAAGFRADGYANEFVSHLPSTAIVFDATSFKSMLESTVFLDTGIQVDLKVLLTDVPTFLYLPRTVVAMCAELIERTHNIRDGVEITWTASVSGERVSLEFECPTRDNTDATMETRNRIIKRCADLFSECPVTVDLIENNIRVLFPVEPVFEGCGSNAYSVAY